LLVIFILGALFTISLYSLDCLKSYREPLNAVGDLVVNDVLLFYKKKKRYPSFEESLTFFKEAGCDEIKSVSFKEFKYTSGEVYRKSNTFLCRYKSKFYKYNLSNAGDIYESYKIKAGKGNTKCSASFYKNGEVLNNFVCQQFSCINLSH